MPAVTEVELHSGQVQFRKEQAPTPPSSSRQGSVTVNVSGSPGSAARFDVSFMVWITCEEQGEDASSTFVLNTFVLSGDDRLPYREVEEQAARQLSPMLRSAADQIDQQIEAAAKHAE